MAEQYDLQSEFTKANNKYFSGKLEPVPLKWHVSNSKLGFVRATVTKDKRVKFKVVEIKQLSMNKSLDFTYDLFLKTFLHELCHLHMLQNYTEFRWDGGYHGSEWKNLANSIGKKANIENLDDAQHEGPLKRKEQYIKTSYVAVSNIDGDASFGLIDPKIMEPIKNDITAIKYQLKLFGIYDAAVYSTRLEVFNDVAVKRKSIRKFTFREWKVNKEALRDLLDGKDGSTLIVPAPLVKSAAY